MPNPITHWEVIGGSDPKKLQDFYAQPGSPSYYAEVDDPQTYLDKAVSLGGKVVMPVTMIPDMVTFAQFTDPEGNIFGIIKSEAHA